MRKKEVGGAAVGDIATPSASFCMCSRQEPKGPYHDPERLNEHYSHRRQLVTRKDGPQYLQDRRRKAGLLNWGLGV